MTATLWVAFGGALGTVLRYWLSLLMVPVSKNLPWGTILINIVGSFVIAFFGVITMAEAKWPVSENIRLFVMVGICGGFTTFSSFSLQSFELLKKGAVGEAFSILLFLSSFVFSRPLWDFTLAARSIIKSL
ncbi:CrcB protein [Bartonella apihabitans]|uniref:Fluoride-specific ion channel FluC n=1 Tax=Bartonella apihabitans TaxID=2750929 RepID=A0A1U9MCW0_9HYPH|nr:CrcB protein [Bartonella apihabitans]